MSKTLLDRIKSGEVTQVVSKHYGGSTKILINESFSQPLQVEFPVVGYRTFSKDGEYWNDCKDIKDISPYNAPESVQGIDLKLPPKDERKAGGFITDTFMYTIGQDEPQPTLEEFAEWVATSSEARYHVKNNCDGKELIELFKQSRNEAN